MDATVLAGLSIFPAAQAALWLDRTGFEGCSRAVAAGARRGGDTPWDDAAGSAFPIGAAPLGPGAAPGAPAQPGLPWKRLPSVPSSAQRKNWD